MVSSQPNTSGPEGAKGRDEQVEQHATGLQATPASTIQHPMGVGEMPILAQSQKAQGAGYGPFTRRQNRAPQQDLSMLPGTLPK
jgi:hypothetical protein